METKIARSGRFLVTLVNGVETFRKEFKSINQAKIANRGNLTPCLQGKA